MNDHNSNNLMLAFFGSLVNASGTFDFKPVKHPRQPRDSGEALVDPTQQEISAERPTIKTIDHPHNSEDDDSQPFRLLDLPAEMRNRIYRFTLCSEDSVRVDHSGYERPGLLYLNHQIRSECLAIFYLENKFAVHTTGYDSAPQFRFWKALPKLSKTPHLHKDPSYRSHPHWRNLMVWLERHHRGEVGGVSSPERQAKHKDVRVETMVVAGMFAVVDGLRWIPWLAVRRLIEAQRPVLVRIDPRWGTEDGTEVQA